MKFFLLISLLLSGAAVAQNKLTNFGSMYIHPNANLAIKGDLQNDGSMNSDGGTMYLIGAASQTISGSAMPEVYNLTLNNSSTTGIILLKNVQVSNAFVLTDGVLTSTPANQVILTDNSTVSGASNNSYVDGPVTKIGNDEIIFPVGKAGNYQPVSISAPALATDRFVAEYFDGDPTTTFGDSIDISIDHVSTCEYWNLTQQTGSSAVIVTPGWNANSCGITVTLDLIVAHWDSTKWENFGNGGITGNLSLGTVRTFSPQSDFGIFTLGSISNENPLPVELISFDALKIDQEVEITWATASERENSYFTIEKTIDGLNFKTLDTIQGTGNTNQYTAYNLIDTNPYDGLSYYRLKQIDIDGKYTFSELRSVYFGESKKLSLYPNPGTGEKLFLVRSKAWEASTVNVYDFGGKLMYTKDYIPSYSNENTMQLDFESPLPSGVFTVQVSNSTEIEQVRFIVR